MSSNPTPEDHPENSALARIVERRASGPRIRILLIVPLDPAMKTHVDSLRRALSMLGHKVFMISGTRHANLIRKTTSGAVPVRHVNLHAVTRILDTFDPDVVLVPSAAYVVDQSSRELAAARGTLLMVLDTLPKPGRMFAEQDYDIYAVSNSDNGSTALTLPFYIGADASLAFGIPTAVPKSGARTFAVKDGAVLKSCFPRLYKKLADGAHLGTTGLLVADDVEPEGSDTALIHIFPPVATPLRQIVGTCTMSVLSGSAVVVPESLSLPAHLASLRSVFTYGGEAQLDELLEKMKGDSAAITLAARRDARTLQSTVLYEDQIHRLFEAVLAEAKSTQCSLGQRVRQRVRDEWTLNGGARGPVVAISGWYGERNIGDELILDSLGQALQRLNPQGQVVVAAPRPSRVEQDHGFAAWPRHQAKSMAQLAQYADCLIIGGGGIWNDKGAAKNGGLGGLFQDAKHSVVNLAALPVLFRALGKPVAGLGLGVGPLREASGKAMVRLMAAMCDLLSVRDANSLRLLKEVSVGGPEPTLDGDLAFNWNPSARISRCGEASGEATLRVGINVRVVDNADRQNEAPLWPGLAEGLKKLAQNFDCEFVGLPFQAEDEPELHRLFRAIGEDERKVLSFDRDPSQAAADLMGMDILVSMRLHASVLGHRQGVPAVGLDYEAKIGDYFRQTGEEARLVGAEASAEELYEVMCDTLRQREAVVARLNPVIRDLEDSARRGLEENLVSLLYLSTRRNLDYWSVIPADRK